MGVGVNPLVGVWSSVILGAVAPLLGCRPGVTVGCDAVIVVPLAAFVKANGVEYIPTVILLASVIQFLFGVFRLGRLTELVTDSVLNGFLNGLGYVLMLTQKKIYTKAPDMNAAIAMAALCVVIVQGLPMLTTAVPSSLVALTLVTILGKALKLDLATLKSAAAPGTFDGGLSALPTPISLSELGSHLKSASAWKLCSGAAITCAAISLLETLLAGKVVDGLKGEHKMATGSTSLTAPLDTPTKSIFGLSAGCAISALMGGFGGCGLIPQSVLNIKSGGGGVLSSAVYALSMASFVIFLAPIVGQISQAALSGIMFTVAYDTMAVAPTIAQFKEVIKGNWVAIAGFIPLLLTAYISVTGDMMVAIVGGILLETALMAAVKKFKKD